jgi:hypothetical protein
MNKLKKRTALERFFFLLLLKAISSQLITAIYIALLVAQLPQAVAVISMVHIANFEYGFSLYNR